MNIPHPELSRVVAALRGELPAWPAGTDCSPLATVAQRHGVMVLLARATKEKTLEDLARPMTGRAMILTHQLRSLLDLLGSRGVTVLPVKGPVLAATAYGDVTLRGVSGDLDLVVRASEFEAALEAMTGNGYRRLEGSIDEHDHEQWESEAHLFPTSGSGTLVELHTELIGNFYTAPVDLEAVLSRARTQALFGTQVRVLSSEDLLLYLCLHGARHMWSRLLWVCDLDAIVRGGPPIDWEGLFARARAIQATRRLTLGLHLAQELLGTPIPTVAGRRSWRLRVLSRLVVRRMTETAEGRETPGLLLRFLSEVGGRETSRQWATYLKKQLEPNARDRAWLRLPRGLRWMHWLLRPFRVLTRYGTGIERPHDH